MRKFFEYDHLGNTRVTYSAAYGCLPHSTTYTVNNVVDYYPYGKVHNGAETEKFLTTRHERDIETQLDYRGARFYDSDVARFLSLDEKLTKYPNLNPYNYVADNPIAFIDPDGKDIISYHIMNLDPSTGQSVGNKGELSANTASVIRQMIMPPSGYELLSQFAKAGQQIAGVTFKTDGKYSNHNLVIADFSMENYDQLLNTNKTGETTSSYDEATGSLTFTIKIVSQVATKAQIAEIYTHESQLHLKTSLEKYINAVQQDGKSGFNRVNADEVKNNYEGERDHKELKSQSTESGSAYNNYYKQMTELLKIMPDYKQAFENVAKIAQKEY